MFRVAERNACLCAKDEHARLTIRLGRLRDNLAADRNAYQRSAC